MSGPGMGRVVHVGAQDPSASSVHYAVRCIRCEEPFGCYADLAQAEHVAEHIKLCQRCDEEREPVSDPPTPEQFLAHAVRLAVEAGARPALARERMSQLAQLYAGTLPEPLLGYPPGWPRCPGCGRHALDGHITCGDVACDEGGRR